MGMAPAGGPDAGSSDCAEAGYIAIHGSATAKNKYLARVAGLMAASISPGPRAYDTAKLARHKATKVPETRPSDGSTGLVWAVLTPRTVQPP